MGRDCVPRWILSFQPAPNACRRLASSHPVSHLDSQATYPRLHHKAAMEHKSSHVEAYEDLRAAQSARPRAAPRHALQARTFVTEVYVSGKIVVFTYLEHMCRIRNPRTSPHLRAPAVHQIDRPSIAGNGEHSCFQVDFILVSVYALYCYTCVSHHRRIYTRVCCVAPGCLDFERPFTSLLLFHCIIFTHHTHDAFLHDRH